MVALFVTYSKNPICKNLQSIVLTQIRLIHQVLQWTYFKKETLAGISVGFLKIKSTRVLLLRGISWWVGKSLAKKLVHQEHKISTLDFPEIG